MTQSPAKKSFFNRNVDLMNGPIFKSLLVFMLPILVSCLFQQFYNTVDTMIVGNVLGDTALAAIGACGAIYELLVGFGIGIGNGLAIVAARAYGAGDEDQLKQTVAGSIVIGIIASAVITLAGAAGLYPLLELLDTPAEILEDAYGYIIIIDLGVIVMFAYNLCAGLLRAIGNSFMPLVFLILSSVLNVILDLWFIAVLGMGVAGAGVATVISQGVSVALCILYVFRSARLLLPGKKPPLLGAVQPEHLHGPHEQHRLGGFCRFAVRHQRPRYAGHRGPHRGPEALRVHGYAPVGDGLCLLDLRLPELRREPSRPRPPRNAGHLSLQCRGGRGCCPAHGGRCGVDGKAGVRLFGAGGAGKRRAVSGLERTLLRRAGNAALHPLRSAEHGREGVAPAVQRHRVSGQDRLRPALYPPLWV